jgi:hypothetical protein
MKKKLHEELRRNPMAFTPKSEKAKTDLPSRN